MSKDTFAGLTLDELDAIGAKAGKEAIRKAHAAGLPATGMIRLRFASGNEAYALTSLHPDGVLEVLDPAVDVDLPSPQPAATDVQIARFNNSAPPSPIKNRRLKRA
jgi:hypothetical protein